MVRRRKSRATPRITGVGAAVANAAFDACGQRARALTITLEKLLG
jgi:xanthine dehydrogenase YagR molybdenum-binding subunit